MNIGQKYSEYMPIPYGGIKLFGILAILLLLNIPLGSYFFKSSLFSHVAVFFAEVSLLTMLCEWYIGTNIFYWLRDYFERNVTGWYLIVYDKQTGGSVEHLYKWSLDKNWKFATEGMGYSIDIKLGGWFKSHSFYQRRIRVKSAHVSVIKDPQGYLHINVADEFGSSVMLSPTDALHILQSSPKEDGKVKLNLSVNPA